MKNSNIRIWKLFVHVVFGFWDEIRGKHFAIQMGPGFFISKFYYKLRMVNFNMYREKIFSQFIWWHWGSINKFKKKKNPIRYWCEWKLVVYSIKIAGFGSLVWKNGGSSEVQNENFLLFSFCLIFSMKNTYCTPWWELL